MFTTKISMVVRNIFEVKVIIRFVHIYFI